MTPTNSLSFALNSAMRCCNRLSNAVEQRMMDEKFDAEKTVNQVIMEAEEILRLLKSQ
jgi:hypothetical protein